VNSLLVIGGSGFFGKSILDAYRRGRLEKWRIAKVYVLSRNACSLALSNPELLSESVFLINSDIVTCNSLPNADYVIHAAASSDAIRYIKDPDLEQKNIISGTSNFCELAVKDLKKSKILYVSSGAVYGATNQNQKVFKEDDLLTSLDSVDINKRYYASAKRISESEIIALGNLGLSVSIARCFAFVGKYLPRDKHFAIGNFIQNGLMKSSIEVKAKGAVYRSYMYADDLVEWLIYIMLSINDSAPIYNVGSEEIVEVRTLAEVVAKNFKDLQIIQTKAKGDIDFYVPSVEKAKKNLGLKAKYNTETAIRETIKRLESEKKY
jgi:nucleoside-diphosphate-sugar epimerase